MSGYIGPIPVPQGIQNKETFTATAGQTTFNTNGYTDGAFISVYLNGVRLINGTDYTATNGSDVVLTTAAAASDVVDFETFNSFSLASQQFENITTKNPTHEDTDGGRESAISFKGEQSGGEISTLAQIQASHDGTADDQKGDLIFKTNDGSDNDAPTERLRIESDGKTKLITANDTAGTSKSLTFGTMAFNRAEIRVTNAATYDGSLEFYTGNASNFAERWRITKDGHFKAATNGNGIDFSASEGSGASSSILDDYEEGTFTPSFTSGVASGSHTHQVGFYTKIGRVVHFEFDIQANTTADNSIIKIDSLPFTSDSTSRLYGNAQINYQGAFLSASDTGSVSLHIGSGNTTLAFYTSAGVNFNGTDANNINGRLIVSGRYFAA